MCLILLAWQVDPATPLWVAANRDEFHARPAAPLAPWGDAPVIAGRDLEAGGTWLGVGGRCRFAAVTNFREASPPEAPRSRGALVHDFLAGTADPRGYLEAIARDGHRYRGFSLLVGDRDALWHYSNRTGEGPAPVAPGIHGLANVAMNTPWPKVVHGREALGAALDAHRHRPAALRGALFDVLGDERDFPPEALPEDPRGPHIARRNARVFIRDHHYGTRASTLVRLSREGYASIHERTWSAGGGAGGTRGFATGPRLGSS
jgi:uncharacterized protein with NRDE domain